jgi:hypothetical protein
MQNNQFYVEPARYDWSGSEEAENPDKRLSGLMGLNQQPQQPNAFASQTPGAPQQPGRVDASSMGQNPMGGEGEMDGDFFSMLAANIASAFGGS